MFLKKILELWNTLAFRLTFWYTTIFIISSFGAFVVIYWNISSTIENRTDHELLNEIEECSAIWKLNGLDGVKNLIVAEVESDGVSKSFFRFTDMSGSEIYTSNMSHWKDIGIGRNALRRLEKGEDYVLETVKVQGRPYGVRLIHGKIAPDRVLQTGMSLEEDALFLQELRRKFSQIMVPLIVFSAFVGWFMARHALGGVEKVTETALDISKGAFERRVRLQYGGKEIKKLATVFNLMLDHISALITNMREMTDNIAHDLKTPITRIRGMAEYYLGVGKAKGLSMDLAADVVEECDHLIQLINTMLDISETEAGAHHFIKQEINLSNVIQKAMDLFYPLASERGVTITDEISNDVAITADLQAVQRMIVNILENAIKYTCSGGTVRVILEEKDDGKVLFSVKDTGIGISEADLPHIFERLYRCDASRSQPGFGLGLSLAQAIAHAHGGNIVANSLPGQGSTFLVILPK